MNVRLFLRLSGLAVIVLAAGLIAGGHAVPLYASSSDSAGAPPGAPAGGLAPSGTGTIAYFSRYGADLRAVNSDGSNDHLIWHNPNPNFLPIDLDWRHDGMALAFSSPHEDSCSQFDSDIYAIGSDGTGLRRVTNAPACAALAPLPKGTVTVQVNTSVLAFVYVPGAPGLVSAPSGTVTVQNVADFGDGVLQQPVGVMGLERQLADPPFPDVKVGQTVPGGILILNDDSGYRWGAGVLTWRADNSSIAYTLRSNTGFNNIVANPAYGQQGTALPVVTGATGSYVDWNPAAGHNDQYLYESAEVNTDAAHGIWLGSIGDASGGTRLYHQAAWELGIGDLKWLPDGSGFLFILTYTGFLDPNGYDCADTYETCSNVFKYDLATSHVTQLTHNSDRAIHAISVSSDGQSIIFERWDDPDQDVGGDLWVMNGDGTDPHLFLEDAARPAWFGPGGAVPAMAPHVTVQLDFTDVYLSWDDFAINTGGYKVRYSETPYFQVDDDGVTTVSLEPGYEGWIHFSGASDPAHNYFYFVQGVGELGALSGPSNRTGVFNFGLTQGS